MLKVLRFSLRQSSAVARYLATDSIGSLATFNKSEPTSSEYANGNEEIVTKCLSKVEVLSIQIRE